MVGSTGLRTPLKTAPWRPPLRRPEFYPARRTEPPLHWDLSLQAPAMHKNRVLLTFAAKGSRWGRSWIDPNLTHTHTMLMNDSTYEKDKKKRGMLLQRQGGLKVKCCKRQQHSLQQHKYQNWNLKMESVTLLRCVIIIKLVQSARIFSKGIHKNFAYYRISRRILCTVMTHR